MRPSTSWPRMIENSGSGNSVSGFTAFFDAGVLYGSTPQNLLCIWR